MPISLYGSCQSALWVPILIFGNKAHTEKFTVEQVTVAFFNHDFCVYIDELLLLLYEFSKPKWLGWHICHLK